MQLNCGHVLPSTATVTRAKSEVGIVHPLETSSVIFIVLARALQPALGVEPISAGTENLLVAGADPGVDADLRARGNDTTVRESETTVRDNTLEDTGNNGVHAHALLDTGVEVRQILGFGVLGRESQSSTEELLDELFLDTRGRQAVPDDSLGDNGSGISTSENVEHQVADDLVVANNVWVRLLGLEEIVEKVAVALGVLAAHALHDALEAVVGGTLKCSELDGAVRVLPKQSVKPRDLSNTTKIPHDHLTGMNHTIDISSRPKKAHILAEGHLPVEIPCCILYPVGEVEGVFLAHKASLELLAEASNDVVCQVLFAENGAHGEVLLVRLEISGVEDVAAGGEDILETLALGTGVGDFVEITLPHISQDHVRDASLHTLR